MTMTATAERCSELERKLIHLSVAIEDRSESIDLLIQAIQDTDKDSESEYQHQNAELRLKHEDTSDRYLAELKHIRNQCADSIEKKKVLASEFEEMVEWKKKEENKLASNFDEIRKRTEVEIQNEKTKWMAGKKKREQQWMVNKVKQVRKATLEALQPELKRLLDNQRAEIEDIEVEKESKTKYVELEAKRNYESKLSDYKLESVSRTRITIARRKEEWMEQISSIRLSFADQMKDLLLPKDDGQSSENAIRNEHTEARNALEDKHTRNMDRVTEARDRRKKEIESSLQQMQKELDENVGEIIKTIEDDDSAKKEAWNKERKALLQNEFEESVNSVYYQIKKDRDRKIDLEIRSSQKEETQFDRDFAAKETERKSSLESDHSKQFQCIEEEISSKRKQLKESTFMIKGLMDSVQTCKDQIDITEQKIKMVQNNITQIRENSLETNAMDEGSSPTPQCTDQVYSINAETKIYQRKLQVAQEKLKKIHGSIENFDMYVHLFY